jgi:hypothetical protein
MASLAEIQAIVQRIHDDLPFLIQRSQIAPRQVVVGNGLSDISERLGLVQAGEFRSGNGREPGFGFSGTRMGYPPFVYNGELWNIVGIENDSLQIGIRASDGKFVFGGGDGFLDEYGLFFMNQEGQIGFQDLTTGTFDNVTIYIDGFDELVLKNSVGLADSGVRFDIDTPAHDVVNYFFHHDVASFPGGLEIGGDLSVGGNWQLAGDLIFTAGSGEIILDDDLPLSEGWFPRYETLTRTGNFTFTVPDTDGEMADVFRKGTKFACVNDGTTKYGVVQSVAWNGTNTTTVTLFTNTDYLLVAGAITDPGVSYIDNPAGFPAYFNWDSAPTNMSVGDGALVSRFSVSDSGWIDYEWSFDLGTTGAVSGQINFTPPAPSDHPGLRPVVGIIAYLETGVVNWAGVVLALNGVAGDPFALRAFDGNTATYVRQVNMGPTIPFTFGAGDGIYITGRYRY